MQYTKIKHGNKKTFSVGLTIFLLLTFCPLGHAADIALEWSNVTDENLTGYTIYYRPDYCCDYKEANGSLAPDVEIEEISVSGAPLNEGTVWEDLVPNLDEHRSYYFVVTASNDNGEESGFSNEARRKAPQIVSLPVVTHVDSTTAVIEWQTDTYGSTVLFYRTQGAIENQHDPFPGVFRIKHSVLLVGLKPATTYYFRAGSSNDLGYDWDLEPDDDNPSLEYTFKTSIAEDTTPPVILNQPSVESITDTSVVVKWQTDEPSSAKVRYDTVAGEWRTYTFKNEDFSVLESNHIVTLTGLTSDTEYYFRVGSADTVPLQTVSSEYTFRTAITPDTTPPIFTSQPTATSITDTAVTIVWETNEPSNSKLRWGTESASWRGYPSQYNDFSQLVRSHNVTITGLKANTKYYFRAGSADSNDVIANQSISAEFTFTTAQAPDVSPPEITSPPTVVSINDTRITIDWETDEPSNSTVIYSQQGWPQPLVRSYSYLTMHHSVTLTNLSPETTYTFVVTSTDAKGNGPTTSQEAQITTLAAPDTVAPQIITPPTITSKSNHTATVEWQTDEPSNSMVWYCQETDDEEVSNRCPTPRTWGNFKPQITNPVAVTDHRIVISDLDGDSTYYLIVGGVDVFGNGPDKEPHDNNPSTEIVILTEPDPDTTAPQFISPPVVTAKSDTTVIIEWETDEPANSMVQYGTASALWGGYLFAKNDHKMVTPHLLALTNLAPSTNYHFRVGAVDENGNGPSVSLEITFKTDDEDNANAPVVVLPPTVTGISNNSAIIEWATDEPGNSVVQYAISDPATEPNPTLEWDSDLVFIASDGSMTTHHRVTLTNLTPQQRYKYRVGSADADGNGPSFAEDEKNNPFVTDTFKTIGIFDTAAPTILSDPVVSVDENNVSQDNQSVIIEWETDEPSTSIVKFGVQQDLQEKIGGTSWQNLPWSNNAAEMKTTHSVTLTNLNPTTTYTFRVGSVDAMGNGPDLNQGSNNPSTLSTFTTADIPDKVTPKITNVQVLVVTNTTALITWETDEPSNSIVRYASGLNEAPIWDNLPDYDMDGNMTRQHSVTLTGLDQSVSFEQLSYYTFMVGSVDATNNGPPLKQSENNPSSQIDKPYFSTKIIPDDDAPQIKNETVEVTAIGDTFVVIEWDTVDYDGEGEPGNSLVQYSNPRSDRMGEAGSNSWGNYPLGENDAEMVIHHKVTLTGLAPDDLYYFRVSSTDAAGNNHATDFMDDNPSIEYNFKTKVADPPSIIVAGHEEYSEAYPKIDYANNTIDITYDEQNIKNANKEGNYIFTTPSHPQPLEFLNPGESIFEIETVNGTSTYRCFMTDIPPETIITLMLTENVTDTDGNPVTPKTVVLNDNDSDGLPDDWEIAWGLDPTNSDIALGQGKNGDFDHDGLSNFVEYLNGTDPKDYSSSLSDPPVPEIVKRLPVDVIDHSMWSKVPNDTAIAVLITDGNRGLGDQPYGIDLTQTDSVRFTITIGHDDEVVETIIADLSTEDSITVVKLYPEEPDNQVSALWVAYHHFHKDTYGSETFPFGASINASIQIKNSNAQLAEEDYSFTIETAEQYNNRIFLSSRSYRTITPEDPSLDDPVYTYDTGIEATSKYILGTKLIHDAEHPVLPQFGVIGGVSIDDVDTIGPGIFIQPPTIFSPSAKLVVPIDSSLNASDVDLYLQDGENWVRACDLVCNPDDGGFGWIVPGSRVNKSSSMEVKVYHSASFQSGIAVRISPASASSSTTDEEAEANCFIDSLLSY